MTNRSMTNRSSARLSTLIIVASMLVAAIAQAATRAEWKAAAEGRLEVEELALARSVDGRKPAGVGQNFDANGQRVYAYLRVLNKGTVQQLRVVWKREGRVYHQATVAVGRSPGWRTWAFITARARMAGRWDVSVLGPDGKLLGGKAFTLVR